MLKKLVTLMIAVSLFTVQAQAATQSGLKAAFDELNYSLSVEWNQTDKAFYEAQVQKFVGVVRDMKAKGLSNEDMMAFAKNEIKDGNAAKSIETAFNMININKMDAQEASNYMMETMKKTYSRGASFEGEVLMYLGIGVLVVALAVAASVGTTSGGSYGGGYGGGCYESYVCDTSCYSDWYYGYTCYDDCYYACY